jgi:Mg-chelatase subunit ChlI
MRSGVDSHRADITIVECAKALAALAGREEIGSEDVLGASALALGHRRAADPVGPAPRVETQMLRRFLDEALEVEVTPKKVGEQTR